MQINTNVKNRREWVKPEILEMQTASSAENNPAKYHYNAESTPYPPTPGVYGPVS